METVSGAVVMAVSEGGAIESLPIVTLLLTGGIVVRKILFYVESYGV